MLNYINHDNPQIQTCVNGTIYSLLKRKVFLEVAKKFNLETVLNQVKVSDPQLKKQIGYIIDEINSTDSEGATSDNDVDETIDEDPTNIDNDTNQVDEGYTELDSIDEDLLKMHYKYLGEFIIKANDINDEEEQRLDNFYRNNPTMIIDEGKKSHDDTVVGSGKNIEEDKSKEKKNVPQGKEEQDEFNTAFEKKDKIPRTPPRDDEI